MPVEATAVNSLNRPWARKGHRAPPLGFCGIGIFRFLSMSN